MEHQPQRLTLNPRETLIQSQTQRFPKENHLTK